MSHNRKSCVALFLEGEYEALTVEAYWESRVVTTRLDSGRHPFSCKYCKETHLSKNMTSYHRMFNLCKVYKGSTPLKMYPTWEKSNPGELHRIAKKWGKVYQSSIICNSPTPIKRKAKGNIELPPLKRRNLVVKAAPKPPKPPSHSKPKRRVKGIVQRAKFEELEHEHDSEGHGHSEDPTDASSEDEFKAQSPRKPSVVPTPTVEPPISKELEYISEGTTSNEKAFHVVRHPRSSKHVIQPPATRILTREEIEERAWRKAKLKFPDGNFDHVPPPPVPIKASVIYVLITEAPVQWMPKELVEDPQSCIQHLYKMLEDGIIREKIGNAFSQWYLYGNLVR